MYEYLTPETRQLICDQVAKDAAATEWTIAAVYQALVANRIIEEPKVDIWGEA